MQSARQSVHKLDSAGLPRFVVPRTSLDLENLIFILLASFYLYFDCRLNGRPCGAWNVQGSKYKKRLFRVTTDALVLSNCPYPIVGKLTQQPIQLVNLNHRVK
jgi:hypothetical protein